MNELDDNIKKALKNSIPLDRSPNAVAKRLFCSFVFELENSPKTREDIFHSNANELNKTIKNKLKKLESDIISNKKLSSELAIQCKEDLISLRERLDFLDLFPREQHNKRGRTKSNLKAFIEEISSLYKDSNNKINWNNVYSFLMQQNSSSLDVLCHNTTIPKERIFESPETLSDFYYNR